MNSSQPLRSRLDRLERGTLIAGAAALAISIAWALTNPTQFFRSYLVAYVFWIGLPLGCLALLMLHHLVGGYWGFVIRRSLEAGSRTFWLMAVLFIPILAGLSRLFAWTRPDAASDPSWQQKHFYLNVPFFVGRAVAYFALWMLVAYFLNKWSSEQDQQTAGPSLASRFQALSGAGLVIYGLTITYASVDWVMSLEKEFFSTIYGMIFMVAPALAALAFVVLVARLLAEHEPLSAVIADSHFQDLGNIMLTFIMLWAYLSFSQFLIIWSGNLQDEIPWYMSRARGGWAGVALLLILFYWAVPFVLLLNRPVKRHMRVLAGVAVALIVMSLVDIYWLVVPAFQPAWPRIHPMDILTTIGIGGLWISRFVAELKKKPLLPLHDARFVEAPFGLREAKSEAS
jgi:hypothetical protein